MKNNLFLKLLLTVLFFSCDKGSVINNPYQVTYEVEISEGEWFGQFIDETGSRICLCTPPFNVGGWSKEFEVYQTPFELHIDAASTLLNKENIDVQTKIYVNGELVASDGNKWAAGVTSSDFLLE